MVQNKTQIGYNTHRYKKVANKILTWKSNHIYKLIYQKISHATFLIKKWTYKENWASSIPEQVCTALLSLLHHCSIYISVSSPNKSFYKHNFLKKLMITLPSEFSPRRNENSELLVALCRWFFWEYSLCDLLVTWGLCFTAKAVSAASFLVRF